MNLSDHIEAFYQGLVNGSVMLLFILAWLTPFMLFAVVLKYVLS